MVHLGTKEASWEEVQAEALLLHLTGLGLQGLVGLAQMRTAALELAVVEREEQLLGLAAVVRPALAAAVMADHHCA